MGTISDNSKSTIRLAAHCKDDLNRAIEILKRGGIVALPTETVYGLAANGLDDDAIARVFAAKGRPSNNPLIYHVSDHNHAEKLYDFSAMATATRKRFDLLAKNFWPGPLTIVAKKSQALPARATASLDTVAVRVVKNQATLTILSALNFPLIMPSANRSTRPSPTCGAHVLSTLDGRIDAVVDDESCQVGIESTVIRIDTDKPVILRPGLITAQKIAAILGEQVIISKPGASATPSSPGQMHLHYAPKIKSVTLLLSMGDVDARWPSDDLILAKKSDYQNAIDRLGERKVCNNDFVLSDEPQKFSQALYRSLYQCEAQKNSHLSIILPKNVNDEWAGIIDRLRRAAGVNN